MDPNRARELLDSERDRLGVIEADLRTEGPDGAADSDDLSDLNVVEQHPADAGSETHDRSRDLGLLEQIESDLRDVEEALARLEDGSYGTCEVCGQPIPDERLEANPTARRDVEHEPAASAPLARHFPPA
ncbi:MAG: hypothetical protein NVS3B12_22610 [Acidimicrobiales bacterium]